MLSSVFDSKSPEVALVPHSCPSALTPLKSHVLKSVEVKKVRSSSPPHFSHIAHCGFPSVPPLPPHHTALAEPRIATPSSTSLSFHNPTHSPCIPAKVRVPRFNDSSTPRPLIIFHLLRSP